MDRRRATRRVYISNPAIVRVHGGGARNLVIAWLGSLSRETVFKLVPSCADKADRGRPSSPFMMNSAKGRKGA